jgi:hypothetical protein
MPVTRSKVKERARDEMFAANVKRHEAEIARRAENTVRLRQAREARDAALAEKAKTAK